MNHLYTGAHMSISHASMVEALDHDEHVLGKNDTAIFINAGWTAAKIMTCSRAYIYVRERTPFSVSDLARFPILVGGKALHLTTAQHDKLETIRAKALGQKKVRQLPRAA